MADPLTYANSDEYVLVNPSDPKVGHLIYDAPMVDAETKQFIRDPETGKIKVYRMVIWGTKGLTQAQVEALITQKNATLVTRINNLDSTLTNFLDADDTTLDQLSELITEIKSNKANIALITSNNATKEELQQAVNTINTNIANSYVDLANDQTITGDKTFTGEVNVPTVDPSDNSTQAASTEFVKNALSSITGTNLNNLVNKDEAQTITGLKTFSTLPQSSVTPTDSKDLANKQYVDDNKVSTDNCVKTSGNQTVAGIKTFTSSPISVTPDVSDNSTKVATTAFVKSQLNNYVKTSGDQTIAGVKTFSSSPKAPTPATTTNDTTVATTAYVKAQNYLTSHQSLANYVNLNNAQTITGNKTLSGTTTVKKVIETAYTNTTATFSTANGSIHTKTVTANFTMALTMDNNETIVIYLINGGNYTVTFPSNLMWIGGEVPSLTKNGKDCLIIQRTANGYMAIANLNIKVKS